MKPPIIPEVLAVHSSNPDLKELSIQPSDEKLVMVTEIPAKLQYFIQNFPGSIDTPYLRLEARNRLLRANEIAIERYNCQLLIWDAYRTSLCQGYLVHHFYYQIENSSTPVAETMNKALRYVAWPDHRAGHKSGGTVDLTMTTADGTPLDMGGNFDEPTDRSFTRAYDDAKDDSKEAVWRDNRRKLYDVMISAGFVNYHEEWWHYEFGTARHTLITNGSLFYPAIELA